MRRELVYILIFIFGTIGFSCNRKVYEMKPDSVKVKSYDTATFNYVYVEGIKQKLLGNGGEAIKFLEQAIRINPSGDAAYFQIAQILLAAGDIQTGKKYASRALTLDENNFWYLMMMAGTYYQEKNLDSAIYIYEKAIKRFPDNESLKITLANLFSENKKYEKATQIFENLDKKYGASETSMAGVVKNLMWAEKWDEALKKAMELLQQFPDVITYNGLLAEIYRGKGEPEKAMKVYKELIERNPDNPQIQLAICEFLLEEKKYEDLLSLLNIVILNEKIAREDKINLFARIIETTELIKESGDKLLISEMVLEAAYPDDNVVIMIRPELLIAQEKLDKAEERLNEIIIKYPTFYYAWEKLLLVLLQKGDYLTLEKKGEECSTLFNRSFVAKLIYATALNENKKYPDALKEIEKAIILAGNNNEMNIQALTLKADVYYRSKDYDNAFRTFGEALKGNNKDVTLLNNYAYYLAEQDMKLKEAQEMSEKAIELDPGNFTFQDTYAWVLYKRGKYREAEKILEGIIKNSKKEDAEYFEHYGYILKKRHDCQRAILVWESALKLDSSKITLLREIENCKK
jgi:tetratricopeptide (TPR) repeat protein